ncbi:Os03g0237250 [Oryza sativa Japonica Group]|uniref:Os03g0237250 protein n=1 Tax=Oryza sativa subsp. japonica TaxID=39947 RepID=C7J0G9_ORYSJ|nr:Os03g0237250 [Oryza sativa Japonica Group]|eukprot:NP_001173337.1 Os03g0237250 [Oryza sativa Japonica Group]
MALVKSHHQMLASSSTSSSSPSSQQQQPPPPASNSSSLAAAAADQPSPAKRKRRPPGTPDPDAEVVALSPRTLLESDRYVCEICGQGFQREQNLQMHRRRHKVPWRLVKRPAAATAAEDGGAAGGGGGAGGGAGGGGARKRVFVCPEPSCLHHDPAHALGDLVGIKKHFRRKHGGRRQWVCARCAKGYAVQSDYKAHLKTCGTRGHSCDCGRVFSRYVHHPLSSSSNLRSVHGGRRRMHYYYYVRTLTIHD